MNFASTIHELDQLIPALTQARQLMVDFSEQHSAPSTPKRKRGATATSTATGSARHTSTRRLSPAAIKRIQEAQRKRWAKYHREKAAQARGKGKKSRAAK